MVQWTILEASCLPQAHSKRPVGCITWSVMLHRLDKLTPPTADLLQQSSNTNTEARLNTRYDLGPTSNIFSCNVIFFQNLPTVQVGNYRPRSFNHWRITPRETSFTCAGNPFTERPSALNTLLLVQHIKHYSSRSAAVCFGSGKATLIWVWWGGGVRWRNSTIYAVDLAEQSKHLMVQISTFWLYVVEFYFSHFLNTVIYIYNYIFYLFFDVDLRYMPVNL